MKTTIYTAISKRIGWEQQTVPVPSIDRAYELLEEVGKEYEFAFEEVFRINRFAKVDSNELEIEAMNVIHRAFMHGEQIFRNKFVDEELSNHH